MSDLHRDVHQLRIDSQKPVPQVSNKSCFLHVRLNIYDLSTIVARICSIISYPKILDYRKPSKACFEGGNFSHTYLQHSHLETKMVTIPLYGTRSTHPSILTLTHHNDHQLSLTILVNSILSLLTFYHGTLVALPQVYHTFNPYYVKSPQYLFCQNIGFSLMSLLD